MQSSRFWQNLWFALLLFLIFSVVYEVDLPVTAGLKEWMAFYLTADYDFSGFISPIQQTAQETAQKTAQQFSFQRLGSLFSQAWEKINPLGGSSSITASPVGR